MFSRHNKFRYGGNSGDSGHAAALGIATHMVSSGELQKATTDLALKLSTGPTRAYAAIKGLMKAWSPGVAVTDLLLSNLSADVLPYGWAYCKHAEGPTIERIEKMKLPFD